MRDRITARFGDDIEKWLADPAVQSAFEDDASESLVGAVRSAHTRAYRRVLAAAQANGSVTNTQLLELASGAKSLDSLNPGLLMRAERLYDEEIFEAESLAQREAGSKACLRCSSTLGRALLRPAMAAAAGSMIRAWERAAAKMGGAVFLSNGELARSCAASAAKSLITH